MTPVRGPQLFIGKPSFECISSRQTKTLLDELSQPDAGVAGQRRVWRVYVDLNQSAHDALGVCKKSQGRYPMAIQRDDHDHWIYGNLEERLLVLVIIAMAAFSPVVMWFH